MRYALAALALLTAAPAYAGCALTSEDGRKVDLVSYMKAERPVYRDGTRYAVAAEGLKARAGDETVYIWMEVEPGSMGSPVLSGTDPKFDRLKLPIRWRSVPKTAVDMFTSIATGPLKGEWTTSCSNSASAAPRAGAVRR